MPQANYSLDEISHLVGARKPIDHGRSTDGNAVLAAGAAAIWPGLGHLVAGKNRWAITLGISWLAILAIALSPLFQPDWLPILIVVIPLGVLFEIFQMVHAAHCARQAEVSLIQDVSARFVAGVVATVIGIGEAYAAITYIQNNYLEICYSPTPSMSPNVSPGDYFMKFKSTGYHRWDIVGLDIPESMNFEYNRLCKRLVGLPGETVEITGSGLMIDGKPIAIPAGAGPYLPIDSSNNALGDPEPLAAGNGCWGRPITLGKDEYYVLGDNTSLSYDARLWPAIENHQPGAAPRDVLSGRIVAIVWPPNRWRVFHSDADK